MFGKFWGMYGIFGEIVVWGLWEGVLLKVNVLGVYKFGLYWISEDVEGEGCGSLESCGNLLERKSFWLICGFCFSFWVEVGVGKGIDIGVFGGFWLFLIFLFVGSRDCIK